MHRWLSIAILAGAFVFSGLAVADESTVGCGEACDTKMIECLKKCPAPPPDQSQDAPYDLECQNECARKVFHPCLDTCKHFKHKAPPKPDVQP